MESTTRARARAFSTTCRMLIAALLAIPLIVRADPEIIAPSLNSILTGTTQAFSWSADATSVEQWWLYAGTSPGASDIANSGNLGSSTQYTMIGLPVNGESVYVRLWYYSAPRWRYTDSVFTAATLSNQTTPAMTTPAAGSELLDGTAQFSWTDNNTPVNYWWLFVGTANGARDIFNSGPSLRNSTSVNVDNLPVDGTEIHARLWFRTAADGWRFQDSVYASGESPDDSDDGSSDDSDSDGSNDGTGEVSAAAIAANLELIANNSTRNTQFDDNAFRDVPSDDISVSDLTLNYDAYNEALLDTSNSGYFRVKCEVSHFAYDDPIVHPNQPGKAHLHMFFGNTQANAYSTYESLMNTGTGTCNGEDLNRTAYWVPALLDEDGNALIPEQIMVYYKNDNFRLNGANELVNPFPDNLRMIAGKASATTPQTGFTGPWNVQPEVSFTCGPPYASNERRQATIPDCAGDGNWLEMQIAFPQCVNEAAGTYQPDQSHMSYSEGGYYGARCPDSHPTDISSIMYRIFFRPDEYGGSLSNLHLSSDVKMDRILPGGTTAHADWYGAWHRETMDLWIENCNNTQADCETGLLGRNPPISLVPRKRDFYGWGYKAPATELIKLCPGKQFDPNDPLRSVAMCRM